VACSPIVDAATAPLEFAGPLPGRRSLRSRLARRLRLRRGRRSHRGIAVEEVTPERVELHAQRRALAGGAEAGLFAHLASRIASPPASPYRLAVRTKLQRLGVLGRRLIGLLSLQRTEVSPQRRPGVRVRDNRWRLAELSAIGGRHARVHRPGSRLWLHWPCRPLYKKNLNKRILQ